MPTFQHSQNPIRANLDSSEIVINVTKNGSSRREPALISDISVGFTAKFEPSYLGCYSKTNFQTRSMG